MRTFLTAVALVWIPAGLGLGGIVVVAHHQHHQQHQPGGVGPVPRMDGVALDDAFDNEADGNRRFKGRTLEVVGRVGVVMRQDGRLVARMTDPRSSLNLLVHCHGRDDESFVGLQTGRPVVIRGVCQGKQPFTLPIIGGVPVVTLTDCILVENGR